MAGHMIICSSLSYHTCLTATFTDTYRYIQFDLTDRSDKSELFSLKFISFSAMADQKPFHLRSNGVIGRQREVKSNCCLPVNHFYNYFTAPTAPITPKVTTSQVIMNPSGGDSETTILFHQPYSISCMKLVGERL